MKKTLRILALALAPALSAVFAQHASAQNGPQCGPAPLVIGNLLDEYNETPTGDILRDDTTWETLELYADMRDGSWSLVGKPHESARSRFNIPAGVDARCILMGGDSGYANLRQNPAMIQLFGPPRTPLPAPQ